MPRGPLAVAVATVAVCAVSTALLAPLSTPAVAAPPNPVSPRLAFTDDRDGLLRVELPVRIPDPGRRVPIDRAGEASP